MTVVTMGRNELRSALVEFHYGVNEFLAGSKRFTRIRHLRSALDEIGNEIKKKYQQSTHKSAIRKLLKENIRNLRSLAQELAENNRVDNSKLLYDLYDGVPLTTSISPGRSYDMVVRSDSERIKAIVFAPSIIEDGFDPIQTQIEAERDFGLTCMKLEERGKFSPNIGLTSASDPEQANSVVSGMNETIRSIPVGAMVSGNSSNVVIGRVLFSRKDQLNLRAEQSKDEIKGFIYEEHISVLKPLDIVVIENTEQNKKIYAVASKIDVNPISGGGYVSKFSELATHVTFQPILETSMDYRGRLRPTDMSDFGIRVPSDDELADVLNVPSRGLPLGTLDYFGSNQIFMYPMLPEDTLYQSMMVAGVQGKGKTNLINLLLRTLAADDKLSLEKRPAMIILDGEGSFRSFTRKRDMSQASRKFLDRFGISDIESTVYAVSDDPSFSNATLSSKGIDLKDIVYLMPELESRTENMLVVLINHVKKILDYEKAPNNISTLRDRLISEVNGSGLIHSSQRPAIARAVLSPSLNLLDQNDKIPLTPALLFKPGSVSVIDCQRLDQNNKRVVALYLLQLLNEFKMNTPNYDPGVLLVIDEAELLFPATPSKADRDYVTRIAARMEDITNRGRKRKYGVVMVTHDPSAVSERVGDLANTKVAFACSGANKWIREYFGKEYVDEINKLPTGTCRITIKIDISGQGAINVRIKVPYVGVANG